MAIKLETQFKGISAEYWKIHAFQYEDVNESITVDMRLYKDKASRDADIKENALTREVFKLTNVGEITVPEGAPEMSPKNMITALLYYKITESNKDEEGNELNKWALGEMAE